MKVFVTGGAGFIGSHVVEQLILDGHKVTVFDNYSNSNYSGLAPEVKLESNFWTVCGDVTLNVERLIQSMKGCDAVIHLAGNYAANAVEEDIAKLHQQELGGFLNVLNAAMMNYIETVRYVTTYGCEDRTHSQFIDDVKAQYADFYSERYEMTIVEIKVANVFGERCNDNAESPTLPHYIFKNVINFGTCKFADCDLVLDWVYAGDLARFLVRSLTDEEDVMGSGRLRAYGLGLKGELCSINEVMRILLPASWRSTEKVDPYEFTPPCYHHPVGENYQSLNGASLKENLLKTLRYYQNHVKNVQK